MRARVLILRTAGTNCDVETAFAFEKAGAQARALHVNRVLEKPGVLKEFEILAIPGGFSYGDDIAAGRIFANQIRHRLGDALQEFVGAGKPIIGICNGFQVLVKTDLLPGPLGGRTGQTCTLAHNDSGRFIDRWIRLKPVESRCIWTRGLDGTIELPIAHGEGKFVPGDDAVRRELWDNQQVALVYAGPDGQAAAPGSANESPDGSTNSSTKSSGDNPNGSVDAIAGICDVTGRMFGLMPHPERHIDALQHPAWTRRLSTQGQHSEGHGLAIFRNAVAYVSGAVVAR